MSYLDFEKAMSLAPKCKFYTTAGGKTKTEIEQSEKMLTLTFSKQCKEFYEKYGYLSFFGNEIYGIDPNDDSGILEGNSVAYALFERDGSNLPTEWLPIYDFNDGNMAYLDYSDLNEDNEPPVIMAFYDGESYIKAETVAEDFGDFLLQLVEEQLND
ncbi:MAG: SMI1/KNR4 family protein [Lachnospiraceae bacterium]|jgi:hypothetical protein|nr:SMI1/KNR4 family protein [Lachnospiraceae bacterium]